MSATRVPPSLAHRCQNPAFAGRRRLDVDDAGLPDGVDEVLATSVIARRAIARADMPPRPGRIGPAITGATS
jgi:hypothetical protein